MAASSTAQQGARVAVMTANSNSGRACVQRLLESYPDVTVQAVFRSASRSEWLSSFPLAEECKASGRLHVVVGADASVPESLPAAFADCNVAVIVTPHDPAAGMKHDADLTGAMVSAAVDAGVKHIIYVGSWTVMAEAELPTLASRFVPTEKLLASLEAKITWTSLRSGYFFDNFAALFGRLRSGDALALPEVFLPAVYPADIGHMAAAIAAVSGAGYENKNIVVSGSEMLSTSELVELFRSKLERPEITLEIKPMDEFVKPMPPYMVELLQYLGKHGKEAVPFNPSGVLDITGRPAETLGDWIATHKHLFAKTA